MKKILLFTIVLSLLLLCNGCRTPYVRYYTPATYYYTVPTTYYYYPNTYYYWW